MHCVCSRRLSSAAWLEPGPLTQAWLATLCSLQGCCAQQLTRGMCLQVHPHSRQAKDLLKIVEDQMVKEGLIGMGIGAAVLTGAGIIIGGLLMGRKR